MAEEFAQEVNLIKIDYASDTIKYIGLAHNGSADDDVEWRITKETLNYDGNVIQSQTYKSLAKWTDRAILPY